jgi:hypothetical protein
VSILLGLRLLDNRDKTNSIYWTRFYSKFKSPLAPGAAPASKGTSSYYDVRRVLIGLSLLTSDSLAVKSELIFDVLSVMDQREGFWIHKEQVHEFLNTFFTVAANYLVILGNDMPNNKKTRYYRIFQEWNQALPRAIADSTANFMQGQSKLEYTGF